MLIYLQMIDAPEDRSKFEVLYRAYRGLMFYIANRILGNSEDAEDAVHDAFVIVAENMKKISDPKCPKTRGYLVTIVESRAIDRYRRKNLHPSQPLSEDFPGWEVPEDRVEDGLAKCILRLPARYREVILLRYDQGYSLRETARMLKLSENAAAKLDWRARKKLEAICEEEGVPL